MRSIGAILVIGALGIGFGSSSAGQRPSTGGGGGLDGPYRPMDVKKVVFTSTHNLLKDYNTDFGGDGTSLYVPTGWDRRESPDLPIANPVSHTKGTTVTLQVTHRLGTFKLNSKRFRVLSPRIKMIQTLLSLVLYQDIGRAPFIHSKADVVPASLAAKLDIELRREIPEAFAAEKRIFFVKQIPRHIINDAQI